MFPNEAAFEVAPDLLCVLDLAGRVLTSNPAWKRVLGWTEPELAARPIGDLFHPDDRQRSVALLTAPPAAGRTDEFEGRCRTSTGEWRWIQWTSAWLPGGERIVAGGRDITEQRDQATKLERSLAEIKELNEHLEESQRALRESEQRLRLAWENAPIGKAIVGLDGQWRTVNPALCEILGRDAETLANLTFQDVTHPDDLDADLALVEQLVDGAISRYELEKRYLSPDGTAVWCLLRVALARDDNGAPEYFVAQLLDIDQRKHQERLLAHEAEERRAAEQAARNERDHLAAVLAAISDAYAYSIEGRLVDVNDQLCTLTGFPREELIGAVPPYPFWPPADRDHLLATAGAVRSSAEGADLEVTFMRKTGEVADGDLLGFVATMRDLSEAKRRERALADIASRDPLTALYNRRAIDARLDQLEADDAVITIDLDHFKAVNDTHGHAAGDQELRTLANAITATLRSTDWAGRLGGEEFIVTLKGGGLDGANRLLDRLRTRWTEAATFTTFSAGISIHQSGDESRQTLARADEALYLAKRAGRDRTETWSAPEIPDPQAHGHSTEPTT
jgi:diguanylate cyclase (GGDEF)-like protein/PAS domain S-box-containing protein